MARTDQHFSGDATRIKEEILQLIVASFEIAMDAGMADDVDHIAATDSVFPSIIVVMRNGTRHQITVSPATANERRSSGKG